jgi:hypothetical protein
MNGSLQNMLCPLFLPPISLPLTSKQPLCHAPLHLALDLRDLHANMIHSAVTPRLAPNPAPHPPLCTAPTCRVGRMAGGPLFPHSVQRRVLLVFRRHAWCLFVLFMSFAIGCVLKTCCNLRHLSLVLPLTFSLEHIYHAAGKPLLVSMILISDTWSMSSFMELRFTQLSADNKGDH